MIFAHLNNIYLQNSELSNSTSLLEVVLPSGMGNCNL